METAFTKNQEYGLVLNVNPSKDHWLSSGAGISGLSYTFVITGKYARIELTISTSSKEKNKEYFHRISAAKNIIEKNFGNPLEWEELAAYKMSRVKYELTGVDLFEENNWEDMSDFLVEHLPKFEKALAPIIQQL